MKKIYLITTLMFLFISASPTLAKGVESGAKTTVKATIPYETDIRIYGYTSSYSLVQAESYRVFAQTTSEGDGYFLFNAIPISAEAKEICLTTIDSEKRIGLPLCIKIPSSSTPSEVGPLLLAPTISLSSGLPILEQQKIAALGKAIPNTEVVVSFFEIPKNTLVSHISSFLADIFTPSVEAADLPRISIKSDKKGNFSINLPTYKPVGFRVFAKAFYREQPSIKSQTLSFGINSIFEFWLRYIFPIFILLLLLICAIILFAIYERKTHKGKALLAVFIESRLKPFAVRKYLRLRRLCYNCQQYLRSSRT